MIIFILPTFKIFSMTGPEIMQKVLDRDEGKKIRMELEMILINKQGGRKIRKLTVAREIGNKEIKTLFEFNSPSDVKGVRFLSVDPKTGKKESRRWIYMPALKRVRRISGSSRNDYFMGSDLTYNDLRKRDVGYENHKLTGEKVIDGSPCFKVLSIPKKNRDFYGRKISYIRKDFFVTVYVEFFNKKGELVKTMKMSDIIKRDGIWLIKSIVVKNLKKQHRTILKFTSIVLGAKLPNSLFSPSRLPGARLN